MDNLERIYGASIYALIVTTIISGDTYDVYPGCDLRATTCGLKFNNGDIHRSFRHVPRVEDTVM